MNNYFCIYISHLPDFKTDEVISFYAIYFFQDKEPLLSKAPEFMGLFCQHIKCHITFTTQPTETNIKMRNLRG